MVTPPPKSYAADGVGAHPGGRRCRHVERRKNSERAIIHLRARPALVLPPAPELAAAPLPAPH